MNRAARPILILFVTAAFCMAHTACGRKGAPRPAADVLPETISDLKAQATPEGIQLSWGRPRRYTGGDKMPDLGGFWVQRADAPGAESTTVATIDVTDLERFQQTKRFRYLDADIEADRTYRYWVVSFTLDRYVSAPSNIAVAHSATKQANGEAAESAPE
jgi:hypothetical protein